MIRTAHPRFARLAAALLLVGTLPGSAAFARAAGAARTAAAEASLIAAEDQMLQAKISRDTAVIARGMADEVTYTHAIGQVQTKEQYLKSITEGRTDYRSIEPVGRIARVSGDLGITHGIVKMLVGERRMQDSYLAAYVKRQGRWQLLFWQSSLERGAMPMGPRPPQGGQAGPQGGAPPSVAPPNPEGSAGAPPR